MRVIDQRNWPRIAHFQLYSGFEFPHVNICVQLRHHRAMGKSFSNWCLTHSHFDLCHHQGVQSCAGVPASYSWRRSG